MRPDLNAHSVETPSGRTRRETAGLGALMRGALVLLGLVGVGLVLSFGTLMEAVAGAYSERVEPMPFDAAVWQSTPAEDSSRSVRLRMIDGLLHAGHLERGTHESVVLNVLGYPDDPAHDSCTAAGEHWCYYLGATPAGTREGGSFARGAWLILRFDDRGELRVWDVVD
ncbi:MAG: hypothetical protein ACF8Q5_05740 [Phycisphaerales bacterium JB040]